MFLYLHEIVWILANSRAITPKCFMGSGWLSNLVEIFCQQTFSQSLMIIQWNFKLLSGQMRWTPPPAAARRTCSHNTSRFFSKGRIKNLKCRRRNENIVVYILLNDIWLGLVFTWYTQLSRTYMKPSLVCRLALMPKSQLKRWPGAVCHF